MSEARIGFTTPLEFFEFEESIRTNEAVRHLRPQSVKTYAAHCRRVAKAVGNSNFAEAPVLEYLDSLKPTIANQLVSALTALLPRFRVHVARYRRGR